MIHRTLITILAIASAAVAAPQNTICPVMPDEAITDTDNVVAEGLAECRPSSNRRLRNTILAGIRLLCSPSTRGSNAS